MEFRVPLYVTVVRGEAPKLDVRSVVIRAGVTEIAENAFRGWTGLEEIVFEPGSRLERIGDRAFAGIALKEFTAPKGLKELGDGVFADCKELKEVKLNEGLESIGDRAFQNSGVEEVHLPSSLQRVGKDAFAGCEHLRGIEQKTSYGVLTVAADSTLIVGTKHEEAEEDHESVQIEMENPSVLTKQVAQNTSQIAELQEQLQKLMRQSEEQSKKLQERDVQL